MEEIDEELYNEACMDSLESIDSIWKNKYLYALSDFENFKRNAAKEKQNTIKYGCESVIKDILPIIDDFERSFQYMDEKTMEGVSIIYNKFLSILEKNNVSIIKPEKLDDFDETVHDAVTVIPGESDECKGKIADCITTGYKIGDKVIRFAKVVTYNNS